MAVFASGLGAPETPRLCGEEGWLCVEMAPPRAGVTHVDAQGVSRQIAPAGCPNGLCVAGDGAIYVADTVPPTLLKVTMDGTVETLFSGGDAGAFLLPNDLCFSSSGLLYLTDSGMLMDDWVVEGAPRPDWETAHFEGKLWEIDLSKGTVVALDRGLRFTNGIAFGPEGDLYVNEMISGNIYRYTTEGGRVQGARTLFANVLNPHWNGGFRGPDGMCFSEDGRLWCSVYGEGVVAVVSTDGEIVERIKTLGKAPTNVAFGPDGERRLYVSEHELGQIECLDVDGQGLALFEGRRK